MTSYSNNDQSKYCIQLIMYHDWTILEYEYDSHTQIFYDSKVCTSSHKNWEYKFCTHT